MTRNTVLLIIAAALPLARLDAQVLGEQGELKDPAPMFASNDVLVMTLEAPFKATLDDRGEDREYHPAVLRYEDPEAGTVSLDLRIRVRGNFRAQRRNCDFPPLRFDVRRSETDGTLFEGQGRMRLVTHCQDRGSDHNRYVLQEYLAYRLYNLLTDLSVRVRLVHLTYVDTEGDSEPFTRYAFFSEDYGVTADRNGWEVLELPVMPPDQIEPTHLAMFEVFQFMIANTDWSVSQKEENEDYCCHNAIMVGTMVGPVYPLPFDFDWAGVVDAPYARPDPMLGIRTVRQRRFWGVCKPREILESVFPLFNEKREEIYELYRSQEGLSEDQVRRTIEYYDEFYDVINNDGKVRGDIMGQCRMMRRGRE